MKKKSKLLWNRVEKMDEITQGKKDLLGTFGPCDWCLDGTSSVSSHQGLSGIRTRVSVF